VDFDGDIEVEESSNLERDSMEGSGTNKSKMPPATIATHVSSLSIASIASKSLSNILKSPQNADVFSENDDDGEDEGSDDSDESEATPDAR
jgi:hypothetical protein